MLLAQKRQFARKDLFRITYRPMQALDRIRAAVTRQVDAALSGHNMVAHRGGDIPKGHIALSVDDADVAGSQLIFHEEFRAGL
jgi:hypothetical protein